MHANRPCKGFVIIFMAENSHGSNMNNLLELKVQRSPRTVVWALHILWPVFILL